jgi:integrase
MGSQKSFLEVAKQHAAVNGVGKEYRDNLLRTARKLSAAGVDSVATVNADRINKLLDSVQGSPSTVAANRRMVCTLIRAALGQRAGRIIDGIRRVKCSVPPPVAWSEKELEKLLAAADGMKRTLSSGCPASLFFRAWILTGYYTGLRFSDLLFLKTSQLRGDRLHHVISKTSQPFTKVLSQEVVALLRQLADHPANVDGKTFFSWALKEHWLRIHFRRLCKQAGLEGTPKWLRRSGATACEAQSPGSASRYLAHRSPELALKYYVDASLLPDAMPTPPRLQHKRVS